MTNQLLESDILDFDRDQFMRDLLRHLSGTLEEVVGLDGAEGFISVVGQRIGEEFDALYRKHFGMAELDRDAIAKALVDLKARIGGDFYVVEIDEQRIVLQNRRCPFGDRVINRPSLCMMTSNVFGVISAENLGYSKIHLDKTIARGDRECRIVITLQPDPEMDTRQDNTREYYAS